jgi:GDP-L-fucose synthase
MNLNSRIYISGHNGLVGSAILRKLKQNGYKNLIVRSHKELDLINQNETKYFFRDEKPEYVFVASAFVGGISANNTYPVDFIIKNIQIQTNVIRYSYENYVRKLIFLGSSCIYPKECIQPIKEEYLMSGKLELTNSAFAMAKLCGIEMCKSYNKQYGCNYISCIPCSLYGIGDNFHPENSHLIPALIQKMHKAKVNNLPEIEIWGTGKPLREFLYVDDLADALLFLMNNYDSKNGLINVGSGIDYSILDIANKIKEITGYTGQFVFDTTKPDGIKQKLLDSSKLTSLGWKPKIEFEEGLRHVYKWYESNYQET